MSWVFDVPEPLKLLCVHRKETAEGTKWEVTLYDGPWCDVFVRAAHESPEVACGMAVAEGLPKALAAAEERAARAATARSARPPAPEGSARPPAPRPRVTAAGSAAPVVSGWTGSVPRAAAEWHVQDGQIEVTLREGLVYPDDGSSYRVFTTIRRAKDDTRSAISLSEYREAEAQGKLL